MAWIGLVFVALMTSLHADVPGCVHEALEHFSPDPTPGWAYTIETTRDTYRLVERFDPARPPGEQWQLLQMENRAPTPDEREKYARSRPTADAGGPKASFAREDIEPGSIEVVREDDQRVEVIAGFRSIATGPDKMLGHLRLRLVVAKQPAFVEAYTLELIEPYWPVLGVKMNELKVTAGFTAPTPDRPSLPQSMKSDFSGRILFIPKTESITVFYRDFQPSRIELSR